MGRRRKGTPPAYRRHRSGQAFSVYNKKSYYFGRHGSAESRRKYREFIQKWERLEVVPPGKVQTVGDLVAAFMLFAKRFYVGPDGKPTSRLGCYRVYLQPLVEGWEENPADDFGRADLKAVQARWAQTLARSTCNFALSMVKRLFRWGVKEEMVRPETLTALQTVEGLPAGRGLARETEPVLPVPDEDLEATLAQAPQQIADMARVQLLIACRAGELRRMRGDEIDWKERPDGVWKFVPSRHKGSHRGKTQVYFVGPRAQKVLLTYLAKAAGGYLFPTGRTPYYADVSYRDALKNAARRAGVKPWSPGRLRHNALTRYDEAAGIQAASTVVGHARVETSQIYAEKNKRQAAELVARLG
jgi:integrase